MPGFGRRFAAIVILMHSVTALAGGMSENAVMDSKTLNDFATRYTAAWCSQHAASVASFFGHQGTLKINGGTPAVGRVAITNSVQSFMTAFPDIVVKMDRLSSWQPLKVRRGRPVAARVIRPGL
jgi:hypothetical protein